MKKNSHETDHPSARKGAPSSPVPPLPQQPTIPTPYRRKSSMDRKSQMFDPRQFEGKAPSSHNRNSHMSNSGLASKSSNAKKPLISELPPNKGTNTKSKVSPSPPPFFKGRRVCYLALLELELE